MSSLGLGCTDGPAPTDPSSPAATEPASPTRAAAPTPLAPTTQLLVTGLQELQGSTVGPGGALFVTAPLTGRIWRVDPETGAVTLFASGLPARIPDFFFIGSGVVDVAGVYRVDGPNSFTVVADLGAFSLANPPATDFFVPTGFQYAIEPFRGGFLVTRGKPYRAGRAGRLTAPAPLCNSELPIPRQRHTRRKPGPQSHGSSLLSATPCGTPARRHVGPLDRRAAVGEGRPSLRSGAS